MLKYLKYFLDIDKFISFFNKITLKILFIKIIFNENSHWQLNNYFFSKNSTYKIILTKTQFKKIIAKGALLVLQLFIRCIIYLMVLKLCYMIVKVHLV